MSTKVQIRQKFAEISGRFDLVTDYTGTDYTDNGADFFLQAGQRELDRMYNTPKAVGRIWDTVAANIYFMKMQDCRAIQNVWLNNATSRIELKKAPYVDLKNDYGTIFSNITKKTPKWYAPAFIRGMETIADSDMNTQATFINYIVDNSDSYNAIIFLPPPDEAFDVEVKGLFYTDWPSAEGETSYWMEIHPMVSIWAGLYMLETSYRNTEGANDWLRAIERSASGIDKDTVEEELSQETVLQMEG